VAGDEPVTSPDQRKPTNMRRLRIAAVVTSLLLLLMAIGNHKGAIENIWLVAVAAGIILLLIVDVILRRNGLRS
jgi:Protein of unknown function (DUF2631)